ncbi:MAG TPA: hypothetical protein PKA88_10320 [Polyangiaceae bacterium]|nr:hypothetical protein [Polyangiaceae bacterium]
MDFGQNPAQPPGPPQPQAPIPGSVPQSVSAELAAMKPARSPVPMMIAAFSGAAVGALLTAFGFLMLSGDPAAEKPVASAAVPSASAPEPVEKKPELTPTQLAAQGDKAALKKLEAKDEKQRSSEEVVAIYSGRAAQKRKEIDELVRKMGLVETYAFDPENKRRVRDFAADREVGNYLLNGLAKMEGSWGVDHLYDVWIKTPGKTESSELARELLGTSEQRAKASPGLRALLELKELSALDAPDCEKAKPLLETLKEKGDQRCLGTVMRMNIKTGCGEKKRDDCWACLRKSDEIKDAVGQAAKRKAP